MKKAAFGTPQGQMVTPTQFMAHATSEYKAKGIRQFCPACEEYLHVYGPSSVGVTSRFMHQPMDPETNPLDDCILAERTSRFRGMEPRGWDFQRGKIMKNYFRDPEKLARAYAFCHSLCGNQNLTVEKFISMIKRADRKNIWSYAGLQDWIVPFILLTLENFSFTRQDESIADFHGILVKPKKTTIDALWEKPSESKIVMIYSDTQRQILRGKIPVQCIVDREAFDERVRDYDWVKKYKILPKLISAL